MRVYKVVGRDNGKCEYVSFLADGKYELIYEIGKITRALPGTLGIFVFKDPIRAQSFAKNGGKCKVLICNTRNFSKKRIRQIACITEPGMDIFYERRRERLNNWGYVRPVPEGTYTCESLKPLKILEV